MKNTIFITSLWNTNSIWISFCLGSFGFPALSFCGVFLGITGDRMHDHIIHSNKIIVHCGCWYRFHRILFFFSVQLIVRNRTSNIPIICPKKNVYLSFVFFILLLVNVLGCWSLRCCCRFFCNVLMQICWFDSGFSCYFASCRRTLIQYKWKFFQKLCDLLHWRRERSVTNALNAHTQIFWIKKKKEIHSMMRVTMSATTLFSNSRFFFVYCCSCLLLWETNKTMLKNHGILMRMERRLTSHDSDDSYSDGHIPLKRYSTATIILFGYHLWPFKQ